MDASPGAKNFNCIRFKYRVGNCFWLLVLKKPSSGSGIPDPINEKIRIDPDSMNWES